MYFEVFWRSFFNRSERAVMGGTRDTGLQMIISSFRMLFPPTGKDIFLRHHITRISLKQQIYNLKK